METIQSRRIAQQFLEDAENFLSIPQAGVHVVIDRSSKREVFLMVRHCYRTSGFDKVHHEFTGGVVYEVTFLQKFGHTSRLPEIKKRLKPGWTKERLVRAISRAFAELWKNENLRIAREELYNRVSKFPYQEYVQEMEEKFSDVNPEYDSMTFEDIKFWTNCIESLECQLENPMIRDDY